MANSRKSEFPKELRKDSVTVKIYRYEREAGALEYHLIYRQAGKRRQIVSRDLDALEKRAEQVLEELARGVSFENSFTSAEREELGTINAIAAEINASAIVAVRHYVEAVKLLGADLVLEACRTYKARNMGVAADITLEKVKEEMITAKKARGKSAVYVQDLSHRLGRFCDSFKNAKVGDIKQNQIQAFLDGLGLAPRTYNNFRVTLLSFFKFAVKRKYLPRDWDEMHGIEATEEGGADVTVFNPDEIAAFLHVAATKKSYAPLIPFFALGAFAGLRSAEIGRLTWDAINFETGYIILKGKVTGADGKVTRLTKTASRRIVPITPALRAWLELIPEEKRQGRVFDYGHTYQYELIAKLCAEKESVEAELKWKANALTTFYRAFLWSYGAIIYWRPPVAPYRIP